jgi:hypothetical protein
MPLEEPVIKPALIEVACAIARKSMLSEDGALVKQSSDAAPVASARYDFKTYSLVVSHSQRDWLDHMVAKGIGKRDKTRLLLEPHSLKAFFQEAFGDAVVEILFTRHFIARLGNGNQKRRAAPQLLVALAEPPRTGVQRLMNRARPPEMTREKKLLEITKLIVKDHRNSLDLGTVPESDEDKALSSDLEKSMTPSSFEVSAIQCLSVRGQITNAGRAVITSSTVANLRDNPSGGPVLGVPAHLAMLMGKQEIVTDPRTLERGPLAYPGAHLYYDPEGNEVVIPPEGLSREEAERATGHCICLRHLVDGDVVALTRSPVVGKQGMVTLPIKIIPGDVITVPDVILSSMDADFDGDAVIIYLPHDRAAAEALDAHRVGNLLCHQSGQLAVGVTLDGFLGMRLAEKWGVPKHVVCRALSRVCASIPPSAVVNLPLVLGPDDLKALANHAAQMDGAFRGDLRTALMLLDAKRGASYVNACQVIGACAMPRLLEPFRLTDFLPDETFERQVHRLVEALRRRLAVLADCGTTAQQRQAYELASVGVLRHFGVEGDSPEAALLTQKATYAVLNLDPRMLSASVWKRRSLRSPRPTYVSEDVSCGGKVTSATRSLAMGLSEPSVQPGYRWKASDQSPKDSMELSETRLGTMNEAKIRVHHEQETMANRGLSSKANIARTGELRHKTAAFLSVVWRDQEGGLRGPKNTALLTGKHRPLGLCLKSICIAEPLASLSSRQSRLGLPWEPMSRAAFEGHAAEAHAADDPVGRQAELEGYNLIKQCFREPLDLDMLCPPLVGCKVCPGMVQRSFSGRGPPLVHCAALGEELPADLRTIQNVSACQDCGAIDLRQYGSLQCEVCSGQMSGCAPVVNFRNEDCSPSHSPPPPERQCPRCYHGIQKFELRVHPVSGSCSAGSRWECNLCGEGSLRSGPHPPSSTEKRAFDRIRRCWGQTRILRTELRSSALAQLGFSRTHKLTLAGHLTSLAGCPCVVADWSARSCTQGAPLDVAVVYTDLATEDSWEALAVEVMGRFVGGVLGTRVANLRLVSAEDAATAVRATWEVPLGVSAATAATTLLRALPVGSRVQVRHNYPAALELHGPDSAEKQMVDDTAGNSVGEGGPARLLAALRTWNGDVLSVKDAPEELQSWQLLDKVPNRTNLRKAFKEAYDGDTVDLAGTKWAAVRSDFGAASVQLLDTSLQLPPMLRAENFNAEPLPCPLPPIKETEDKNLLATPEERAKCIGVRQLQLLALQPDASPPGAAEEELSEGRVAFLIRRRDYLVSSRSLIW